MVGAIRIADLVILDYREMFEKTKTHNKKAQVLARDK